MKILDLEYRIGQTIEDKVVVLDEISSVSRSGTSQEFHVRMKNGYMFVANKDIAQQIVKAMNELAGPGNTVLIK
jgi:hypothetical protein